jgi:prepilin-type processing-associated H-X9-DG protein
VRRPEQTVQITDGFTVRYSPHLTNCEIRPRHRNGLLNGAFLDGHAGAITDAAWNRVDQDARSVFYALAAADRSANGA